MFENYHFVDFHTLLKKKTAPPQKKKTPCYGPSHMFSNPQSSGRDRIHQGVLSKNATAADDDS